LYVLLRFAAPGELSTLQSFCFSFLPCFAVSVPKHYPAAIQNVRLLSMQCPVAFKARSGYCQSNFWLLSKDCQMIINAVSGCHQTVRLLSQQCPVTIKECSATITSVRIGCQSIARLLSK
jgi:hypothetical protein